MANRRGFLASLLALPFVGRMVPKAVEPEVWGEPVIAPLVAPNTNPIQWRTMEWFRENYPEPEGAWYPSSVGVWHYNPRTGKSTPVTVKP